MFVKVIVGDELCNKFGNLLGDIFLGELGVFVSVFGVGVLCFIICGMEGLCVMILQNGMGVFDVFIVFNDYVVVIEVVIVCQIEILCGLVVLLYGLGVIGGLVNVVNDCIFIELVGKFIGIVEGCYGIVDGEKNMFFLLDILVGQIGLYLDGNYCDIDNYKIFGNVCQGDSSSVLGCLFNFFIYEISLGGGIFYVINWGYVGLLVVILDDYYGILIDEKFFIDLYQNCYDFDIVVNYFFVGIEKFCFCMGYIDYIYIEKVEDGMFNMVFFNCVVQICWELMYVLLVGWYGIFGVQIEQSNYLVFMFDIGVFELILFMCLMFFVGFLVEECQFGQVLVSVGLCVESVSCCLDSGSGLLGCDFSLIFWFIGGLWIFQFGYGLGLIYFFVQCVLMVEELYFNGLYELIFIYDIGDNQLKKEILYNIELSLQKIEGLVCWKGNVFCNKVNNYIYGCINGQVDDIGVVDFNGEFIQCFWLQGDVIICGVEVEVIYNWNGEGVFGWVFVDILCGMFDNFGNLFL